ncbi:MAG TPA: cupredoxin family copper-binding protein [Solirubrobacteraceae bacterium]|nr:cupredoxin family copper-binding protein [Solirubrobacteraceae bacterium]
MSVRPRGPSKKHHRRHHRACKQQHPRPHRAREQHVAAVAGAKHSITASANSASDPRVTIADFSFTPASVTVHVGDTVQWFNNGPSAHTATADNGSFNTGVLQKGQSASVTFHSPGTFAYHCAIHPFMHGTVVVLANSKTSSPGSSGSAGHSSSSGGAANGGTQSNGAATGASHANKGSAGNSQGSLPLTGVSVVALVVAGLVLTGSGLGLQWLRRRGLG